MAVDVDVKKDFGDFGLDISFRSGSRRIGILGASGSGKSMTLKCLAGIERPDEGRIAINGQVMYDSAKKLSLRPQVRRVGYLFQNYALFPTMTIEQNIAAGLSGKKKEISEKVGALLGRFGLEGLGKRLPGELSGGQQQRAALARILICEPQVILLDEPFSALDVYLRDQMQRELMELLTEYRGTVILVSHNRDEIYRMSDEVLVMDRGRIAAQGETRELFAHPPNVAAARLTGCKNIAEISSFGEGIFLRDWNLTLPLHVKEEQGIRAVAIRAHRFRMREAGAAFPVLEPIVTEDLFEYNISFKVSANAPKRIDWKISKELWNGKEDGMPDRIYLNLSDVMLLK